MQALCDADLATQDNHLETATGNLKRGIKYSGQLHPGEQFPHIYRVATLIAVQWGWAGMEPLASKRQFKWYLEEFGKSPSERNARVHIHNWGGCDTLCMAANYLRRNIYVIAKVNDWQCSLYRPSSLSRCNKVIETGEQLIRMVAECGSLIAQDKQNEDGQWPIVLHYADRHYSAFIHRQKACQPNDSGSSTGPDAKIIKDSTCPDVVMNDVGAIIFTERVRAHEEVTDESMSGGHFEPWNTENGKGHLNELHERCQELSIPQRLQSAIHQIIDSKDPQRCRDWLLFLTATVPAISHKDQERIEITIVTDTTHSNVIQLQQQHHLAPCILQQQHHLAPCILQH